MEFDLRSRERILYVARSVVSRFGLSKDLAEDFTHDLVVQFLERHGENFGFSTFSLYRKLLGRGMAWIKPRPYQDKKLASTYLRASLPPSPISLLRLQEIWNQGTPADQEAITDLLLHSRKPYGKDDSPDRGLASNRRCRLKRLRQKLQGATKVRRRDASMRSPCFQVRIPTELAGRLNSLTTTLIDSPLLVKIGYRGNANPLPLTVVVKLVLLVGLDQLEKIP